MKYLLVTVFILVVYWLWRHNREAERSEAAASMPHPGPGPGPAAGRKAIETTEVVACEICGLHLPRTEALIGHKGFFCSDAHRRQAENG